jgi:hypothetical protein
VDASQEADAMLRLVKFAALAAAIAFGGTSWCQQTDPQQEKQSVHGAQGGQSVPPSGSESRDEAKTTVGEGSPGASPAPAHNSIAAAARKSREQKKQSSKTPKVFTNENIPTAGGISSVGASTSGEKTSTGGASAGNDEKAWRQRFAKLRKKQEQDKQDLDVMQRELGVLDVQYYNDPVKGMQQGLTRSDINDKSAKIDEKKKEIDADQQAIDGAEDELRRAGGDPGWSR